MPNAKCHPFDKLRMTLNLSKGQMPNAAFTLIEVIVVVGMMVVVIGIGAGLMVNVIRGTNKAAVTNLMRQNASIALDSIERDTRAAVGLPLAESSCGTECRYNAISLVLPGSESGIRYMLCADYDNSQQGAARCRTTCPSGPCVGHVRRFSCPTWEPSRRQFQLSACTDTGAVTGVDREEGIELDAVNSAFLVQTSGRSVIVRPKLTFRSTPGTFGQGFSLSAPAHFESTFVVRNE